MVKELTFKIVIELFIKTYYVIKIFSHCTKLIVTMKITAYKKIVVIIALRISDFNSNDAVK